MIDHYENAYETIDKLREEVMDAENLEAVMIKRIRKLKEALQNAVNKCDRCGAMTGSKRKEN